MANAKTATKKSATKKSPAKKAAPSKSVRNSAAKSTDATRLLRADHRTVNDLFEQYESTRSTARKKKLVEQVCAELTVHAQIEEEIFYPAVKQALKDKELIPEATVEHATVKHLIAQIEGIEPDGEMYDAKVKVLSEYVKHHVKEEEGEMFKKAKATKLDLVALGEQMAARKQELLGLKG